MGRHHLIKVLGLAAAAGILLGACGSSGGGSANGDELPGQDIYKRNCATCHGGDGGGGIGPGLKGIADKYDMPTHIAIIAEGSASGLIEGGGSAGMPGWKEQLTPEEIRLVAEYERSLE